jgi:hypothetical protein
MTGWIDLNFTYQNPPEVDPLPVVVDVVNADLDQVVPPRSVTLHDETIFDLKPGTYLTRVLFPSGNVARQTCTVAEGEKTPVNIDVHALSGHESLERSAVLRPLIRDETTPGLEGETFVKAWVRRWHRVDGQPWSAIAFDGSNRHRDAQTVRYSFQLDRAPQLLQLGGPNVAWRFVALPPGAQVDVTITPRLDGDLAISVTTQSEQAEALLGYLRSGAIEDADVIAETLLARKMGDPIAAAIGGYYLLRVGRLARLADWGGNLSAWFPWLADGPVINGWQHLHAGRRGDGDLESEFRAARSEFLLAVERGLPVYTEGLRLLFDGLRLVSEDADSHDEEVTQALDRVEPFAQAADWSAATVTYGGEDPAEPSVSRLHGVPTDRDGLVLLQQLRLQDLIDLGWISPGTRLVTGERSRKATAILTSDGALQVDGVGSFRRPEETAETLGVSPDWYTWFEWQFADPSAISSGLLANMGQLGRPPSLADVRSAALGE